MGARLVRDAVVPIQQGASAGMLRSRVGRPARQSSVWGRENAAMGRGAAVVIFCQEGIRAMSMHSWLQ